MQNDIQMLMLHYMRAAVANIQNSSKSSQHPTILESDYSIEHEQKHEQTNTTCVP